MKSVKREELAIHSVHRSLLTVLVMVVVTGALFYVNTFHPELLGPIKGGIINDYTLRWSVSDHNDSDGRMLVNKLSGTTDNPKYNDRDDHVIKLDRNPDGSLPRLPRIQGTLEFYKN